MLFGWRKRGGLTFSELEGSFRGGLVGVVVAAERGRGVVGERCGEGDVGEGSRGWGGCCEAS